MDLLIIFEEKKKKNFYFMCLDPEDCTVLAKIIFQDVSFSGNSFETFKLY